MLKVSSLTLSLNRVGDSDLKVLRHFPTPLIIMGLQWNLCNPSFCLLFVMQTQSGEADVKLCLRLVH